jgi:hypothetical protein
MLKGKKGKRRLMYLTQDTTPDDRWWPCMAPENWPEAAKKKDDHFDTPGHPDDDTDSGLPSLSLPVRMQFEEHDPNSYRIVRERRHLAFNSPIPSHLVAVGMLLWRWGKDAREREREIDVTVSLFFFGEW